MPELDTSMQNSAFVEEPPDINVILLLNTLIIKKNTRYVEILTVQ